MERRPDEQWSVMMQGGGQHAGEMLPGGRLPLRIGFANYWGLAMVWHIYQPRAKF
jgi:hypothetical protein